MTTEYNPLETSPLDALNPERRVQELAAKAARDRRVIELVQAFNDVFSVDSTAVAIVLEDLAEFCHYGSTTVEYGKPNSTLEHLPILEGRRQVYLRIKHYMEGATE